MIHQNRCMKCLNATSTEGDRWAIYNFDGHHIPVKDDSTTCEQLKVVILLRILRTTIVSRLNFGGSDKEANQQWLHKNHHDEKKGTIGPNIKSVHDVTKDMVSERFHPVLDKAKEENWSLDKLVSQLKIAMEEFLRWKVSLTDDDLKAFFTSQIISPPLRNNLLQHDVERAVHKFRKWCSNSPHRWDPEHKDYAVGLSAVSRLKLSSVLMGLDYLCFFAQSWPFLTTLSTSHWPLARRFRSRTSWSYESVRIISMIFCSKEAFNFRSIVGMLSLRSEGMMVIGAQSFQQLFNAQVLLNLVGLLDVARCTHGLEISGIMDSSCSQWYDMVHVHPSAGQCSLTLAELHRKWPPCTTHTTEAPDLLRLSGPRVPVTCCKPFPLAQSLGHSGHRFALNADIVQAFLHIPADSEGGWVLPMIAVRTLHFCPNRFPIPLPNLVISHRNTARFFPLAACLFLAKFPVDFVTYFAISLQVPPVILF